MVFFATRGLLGPSGTMLSDFEEGALVKLNENGSPVEFYVAKHDYEPDLNGAGRTLLVRKDCYAEMAWNSSGNNAYSNSTVDIYLNGTYKSVLDTSIQSKIGTTKFKYTIGNGNNNLATLERSIFLIGLSEMGVSHEYANPDGTEIPISDVLKVAKFDEEAVYWTTRTPLTVNTVQIFKFNTSGIVSYDWGVTDAHGVRPVLTIPSESLVRSNGLIV